MTNGYSTAVPHISDRQITEQVIDAVAMEEEADPLSLPPLYEAVDPDALNSLFAGSPYPPTVHFTYLGYQITVTEEREISITEVDEDVPTKNAQERSV